MTETVAPVRSLCLGTAQLGMRYGIANRTGLLSQDDAVQLLVSAMSAGVGCLDTARAYGTSESLIGRALSAFPTGTVKVCTKLAPLDHLRPDADDVEVYAAVDASVESSCRALGVAALDTLMLHRWSNMRDFDGRVWKRLCWLKHSGLIERLGVSVYHPAQAIEALDVPHVEHIQLPFNVLDWRWGAADIEAAVQRRPDVVIHARSVFLQGLLVSGPNVWPAIAGVEAHRLVASLEALARCLDLAGRAELCLAFVLSQNWVDQVVIGVDCDQQLQENLELIRCRRLTSEECARVTSQLPRVSDVLLDPSLWPAADGKPS